MAVKVTLSVVQLGGTLDVEQGSSKDRDSVAVMEYFQGVKGDSGNASTVAGPQGVAGISPSIDYPDLTILFDNALV